MTHDKSRRWVHRIGYFSACLILFGMVVFLVVGIRGTRRAGRLREDICQLELGGFEPPTLCLEATQYKTLSAAAGVAYEEARHLSRP